MTYLTNAASCVIQWCLQNGLRAADFGSRFQIAAAHALRSQWPDLYCNFGAGQPDAYSNAGQIGFEMKATQPLDVVLDGNSWSALGTYDHRVLIALNTDMAPYRLWAVDLHRAAGGNWPIGDRPVRLSNATPVDRELEVHLAKSISASLTMLGPMRFARLDRDELQRLIGLR
jgi:hypothetical protein